MSKAKIIAESTYRLVLLVVLIFIGTRLHALVAHQTDVLPPYVRVWGPVQVTNPKSLSGGSSSLPLHIEVADERELREAIRRAVVDGMNIVLERRDKVEAVLNYRPDWTPDQVEEFISELEVIQTLKAGMDGVEREKLEKREAELLESLKGR